MSSKQKIAISAIGIVLVLAIIGLTIGLVLVANTVSSGSSMSVTYKANNVAATIVASGKNYKTAGDSAPAVIKVDEKESNSVSITANQDTLGGFSFAQATLTANGYAEYTFAITNNLGDGEANIKVEATIAAADGAKNITILIGAGATEAEAKDALAATTTGIPTGIAPSATGYVVVRMSVTDAKSGASATGNLTIALTNMAV